MIERGEKLRVFRALPWGIIAIIAALSLVEPLTHAWIAHFPPKGAVPTGMHTGDSAHLMHCTASIASGFYSPYTTVTHRADGRDYRLYMVPYFLLYALLGLPNLLLHMEPFLYFGLLNGLACAVYLLAAYRFLCEVLPRHARRAFYLFTLGGGLGGVAFLVSWLIGWVDAPGFQADFQRLAQYELIEGQSLSPLLLSTRLYYTLPLAAGLYGLTLFIRGLRQGRWTPVALAGVFNAFAGFVNLRMGPLFWALAMAWLLIGEPGRRQDRAKAALLLTVPTILAAGGAWGLMSLTYYFRENVSGMTNGATWFIPFLTTTVFFWIVLFPFLRARIPRLPGGVLLPACGALGYLGAYSLLYLGYVAYYGNWLRGGDTSATILLSDWALPGGVAGVFGAVWIARCRPPLPATEEDREIAWLILWLLGFTALTLSAFGQCWFLRFTPQRLLVLLPLPLAALTAVGLSGLPRPVARAAWATLVACGMVSLTVAGLYFQGPLGREPGQGPFAYLHYEYVTEADGRLMDKIPPGAVLVPPWSPIHMGEIVAMRPGLRPLGGPGAANLSELPFRELQPLAASFFQPATSTAARRDLVTRFGVGAVFCPDTCPVDPALLEQLDHTPWLRKAAAEGRGCVYTVRLPDPANGSPSSGEGRFTSFRARVDAR